MVEELRIKRENSGSSDEQSNAKRPRASVDMSQKHPNEPLANQSMPTPARVLPAASSSSSSNTTTMPVASSAYSQTPSSGVTQTATSTTTAAKTWPIASTADFDVIWFTFTPSCGRPDCKDCSPRCIPKRLLELHSPWAKREIQKMEGTGRFSIALPRSQRLHVGLFIAWTYAHRPCIVYDRRPGLADPRILVAMLHGAGKWENPRFEKQLKIQIVELVDKSTTTPAIAKADGKAADFVRTVLVLKYLALIQVNDVLGLRRVFPVAEDQALASIKVLLDQHRDLPREMKFGKVRASLMDWKNELLLSED